MNARNKSSREKSSGKKEKREAKKELKDRTVAAEIGGAVMREAAAKPEPAPVSASEAPVSKKPPEPRAALATSEAKASKKPAEPRPAQAAKPRSEPRPEPRPAPVAKPRSEPHPEPRAEAVESDVATIERSFKAAGRGTIAVNRKLIDFARENVNCGLDHVKDLAAARNPVRIMRLQMEYWHDCLATFASQAQELRALSAELVANANEPIREHMRRSLRARAA